MASPLQLRGERGPEAHLPYAAHASEHVVRLDSGALITAFALAGIGHETADTRRLNDLHEKLNAAWRNLARPDLAVWHHVVRRPIELPPRTGFRTAFAAESSIVMNSLAWWIVMRALSPVPTNLRASGCFSSSARITSC